jgi:purine-cytosine permease-like protein
MIDIIGWIGSVMVVLAYALNMYKRLASDSREYYLLNIIGSACLILNTLYHHAIPSAVVNIIWVLIALAALVNRKR